MQGRRDAYTMEVTAVRAFSTIGALALLAAITLSAAAGPTAFSHAASATPAASPSPACPVTQPNGVEPPASANVFGRGNGDYGNDALWTSLWIWGQGEVRVPLDALGPSGWMGDLKWAWYRFVPGELSIEGRRLDAPAAPMQANIAEGNEGAGFEATGLIFPSGGCWQITGHVGGKSLTFVVLVVPPKAPPLGHPMSNPTATCLPSAAVPIPGAAPYFADTGLGGPPVWLVGWGPRLGAAAPVAKPGTVDPTAPRPDGWPMKGLWVIDPASASGPIMISGVERATGLPLLIEFSDHPPSATVVFYPTEPGIPIQHGDWREFPSLLIFPASGCYDLTASWQGGSWKVTVPFVAWPTGT